MNGDSVAGLARKMGPSCVDVVDVDELVAAIEATGINDRVARARYGHTTVFSLGEAVLTHLQADRAHQMARLAAQVRRPARPAPYVGHALLRCALYLTPVLLAVAAAEPLGRVPWAAPAAALVLGWSGAQALAYLGHFVGAHRGPGPASRVLAAGFTTVAAAWSGVLALAPDSFVGGERAMACAVTLVELAYSAAVATALVTRSERAVLAWTVPSWFVAGLAITGWWPKDGPAGVQWALAATIALTIARAFRHITAPGTGTGISTGIAEVRRALAYLLIGGGQALAFVLVWRAAPGGPATPPAALPLLAAVPLLEVFVGWHTARVAVGLDVYDDHRAYRRHIRWVAILTLAALVPPLFTGVALGAGAYRLPLRLGDHPDPTAIVLALSNGVLLAGVFATVLLLATRRQLGLAAALAGAPTLLAVGLTVAAPGTLLWLASTAAPTSGPPDGPAERAAAGQAAGNAVGQASGNAVGQAAGDAVGQAAAGATARPPTGCTLTCLTADALLPNTVVALAVVYVVGLVIVTYVLFDPWSYR